MGEYGFEWGVEIRDEVDGVIRERMRHMASGGKMRRAKEGEKE